MKIKAAVLYELGGRLEVEDIELTDQLRLRRPGTGHSLRDYPRRSLLPNKQYQAARVGAVSPVNPIDSESALRSP